MKKLRNLPTETPISQHIKTLVAKEGIAPQIEVAMNRIVESRIEYFLPTRSAMKPQIRDPTTVPDIATVGSTAPSVLVRPYSASRPGIIKPIVAGFIMSIVIASVSTADSFVCAGVQSALCSSSKYAEERKIKIVRMTVKTIALLLGFKCYSHRLSFLTLGKYNWFLIHAECLHIVKCEHEDRAGN